MPGLHVSEDSPWAVEQWVIKGHAFGGGARGRWSCGRGICFGTG